jgi:hypothetical protein
MSTDVGVDIADRSKEKTGETAIGTSSRDLGSRVEGVRRSECWGIPTSPEGNMGCGTSSQLEVMPPYTGIAPTTTQLGTMGQNAEALHGHANLIPTADVGRCVSPEGCVQHNKGSPQELEGAQPLNTSAQELYKDGESPPPPETESERPVVKKKSDAKDPVVHKSEEHDLPHNTSHPGPVEGCMYRLISLDEQIKKLYGEIMEGKDELMAWDSLHRNSSVLANGLLALGIGQNVENFIQHSFEEFRSNTIACSAFQKKLKEEWEISRKLAWLAQTDVLRCIAKSLAPAIDEGNPLSGIQDLKKSDVFTLVESMFPDIAACLSLNIEAIPKVKVMEEPENQINNSKFCVDPVLFTMK